MSAELAAHRGSHDANKQLDPDVVGMLREQAWHASLVPHLLGGAELEPAAYVELLEAIASGDSATGWVTMTASTSALLGAYLPRAAATALFATGAPLMAGVFAPGGSLDEHGVLTGKWSWASGCRHADWFAVGSLRERRHVVCFVPRASVRIVDNWDTLGLAGTGSHDIAIDNVKIFPEHTCSLFGTEPWPDTPLYRVPVFGLLATGIAACALGIAKTALGLAAERLRREKDPPSPQIVKYAELHAELAAARAYLLATCTSVFAAAQQRAVDPAARGGLRLAASSVTERCAEVVRGCFHLDGAAALRGRHPLQLALRDIEVVMTHKMVVDRVLPAAGRALLGLGTPPPDL
ncbi:MAG TPA: acyl-CoA dehydrogenase family protein [Kofleriaceae bacterium]|nr:acyl-CoA dehydrogenase family protein [Kofleriaceae bacterium]